MGNGKNSIFDPRAGLWILIAANIIAFSDHTLWVELALIALLLGMVGSPLPIWLMREDFLRQITEQGMPADYVNTLAALSSNSMLVVLFLAPVVGAIIGGFIARAMFRKHFEKAGLV